MNQNIFPVLSPRLPRIAVVTGGARRLGRGIALALARAGFDIGLHVHHSLEAAEETAADIRRLGKRVVLLHADLAVEDQVQPLMQQAYKELGPVGILVNNASTFERDECDSVTRESWDYHMEPNLRAPFVLTQNFAALLPHTAEGVVINMLDQRVWSPTPHFMSYSLSKAGLWALTQSMALALAPRIRVCGIGPGPALPSARQTEAQFARQTRSTPLGRGTSPDEVARAVLAVLSLPAFTGQMLALDGGQHLQWSAADPAQEIEE